MLPLLLLEAQNFASHGDLQSGTAYSSLLCYIHTHSLSLLRCHDETIFERVKKCKLALKDRLFKQNIFLTPLSITYEGIDI